MSLLILVLSLLAVGIITWLLLQIPMFGTASKLIKAVATIVCVILVLVWVLGLFGIASPIHLH